MIDTVGVIRAFLVASVAVPASSTLESELAADGGTITLVTDGGDGFPSTGNFVVKIESEIIRVLSRSGDVLTVSEEGRASMGSTAAVHAATTAVSQGNLYTIVGANVEYPKIPADYDNDEPLVRFATRGGRSDANVHVHEPSYQFDCLGGSLDERDAKLVYRLLYDRLKGVHGESTSEGELISAVEEGIGQDLEYPDTDPKWPYTLSFFRIVCGPS